MAGTVLGDGTTIKRYPGSGATQYFSSDGKAYDTLAAAKNASKVYNGAIKEATAKTRTMSQYSSGSSGSSDLVNDFLKKWGDINDQSLKIYNNLLIGYDDLAADSSLKDLIAEVKQQAADYSQMYGGLEQESVASARADLQARGELRGKIMGQTDTQYENVTGRVNADITGAAETARAGQEREMLSYGAMPGSGEFGAMTRKSFMDEARDKTIAMNIARRGEKERAYGATMAAYNAINPNEDAALASGIASQKASFTGMQSDLVRGENDRQLSILDAKAGIAGRMGAIGSQYGSFGATLAGIDAGRNENYDSSSFASLYANRSTSTPTSSGPRYSSPTPSASASEPSVTPGKSTPASRLDAMNEEIAARFS